MKILLFTMLILSIWTKEMKEQKKNTDRNLESSFLQNELTEYSSLKLWVNNYLEMIDVTDNINRIDEKVKAFSWQYNLNYVDETFKLDDEIIYLRRFVDRFIRTIPIPQWPMVVRYMVFPQIYGYYSNDVIRNYLLKLYKFEAKYHSFITGDTFNQNAANDMFSAMNADDIEKLKQLEKLSRLEQLKREVFIILYSLLG